MISVVLKGAAGLLCSKYYTMWFRHVRSHSFHEHLLGLGHIYFRKKEICDTKNINKK